jgi:hypothetical protein
MTSTMTNLEMLDENGFIFLDDASRPYWCRMWHGRPWLMYWHEAQRSFVTLREVNQMDIWSFPHNLSERNQQLYRDQHDKFMQEFTVYLEER